MRAKYLIYGVLGVLVVVAGLIVWAFKPPFGAAVCFVNFKGTTYDQAVALRDALSQQGMDAGLSGQRGGPRRTPVVTVDGGFWDSSEGLEDDVRAELSEIGGGQIQTCFDRSLGD